VISQCVAPVSDLEDFSTTRAAGWMVVGCVRTGSHALEVANGTGKEARRSFRGFLPERLAASLTTHSCCRRLAAASPQLRILSRGAAAGAAEVRAPMRHVFAFKISRLLCRQDGRRRAPPPAAHGSRAVGRQPPGEARRQAAGAAAGRSTTRSGPQRSQACFRPPLILMP
jgi:hypothetical protein